MAKVLLVERDPVLAAAIEDVFRAAGHRVALVSDPDAAVTAAGDGGAEAVVIETVGAAGALDAVRTLRRRPETRDLPLVLIDAGRGRSGNDQPPLDRLGALRAGASDLLSHPVDPEELLLRLERLIEGGGTATPALSGDLGSDPLPELIQYLEHMGKSGELVVRSAPRSGRVRFEGGRAVEATCGPLTGAEALLTLLEADRGRFRFASRTADAAQDAGEKKGGKALPTMSLLLFASWMRDELEHRRRLLPATGEPLKLTGTPAPKPEEELARLPVVEVMAQIGSRSGSRLYDLVEAIPAPPRAVRLAVAWLIEQGAVAGAGAEEREEAFPTTREIDGALLLELAVDELRAATDESRTAGGAAPFVLLAEEGAWPNLLSLFDRLPKSGRAEPFHDLGGQLLQRHGGSARLDAESGRVVLHVQALSDKARLQIGSLVPQCAAMVIWLHRGEHEAAVRAAVEHLQEMDGEPSGVLIASTPEATSLAERLTALNSRWATTPHPPRSLLAVLRLLRGRP